MAERDPLPDVVSWNDGADHVIQAYTHPSDSGWVLKIKRYTVAAYHGAAQSGHHQMLCDKRLPTGIRSREVDRILQTFGCPDSQLPSRGHG